MDIIEIRNNLVKLSYGEDESPQLGQFIALTAENKSYVAQFVNLKADNLNNFAVARLIFTFTSDGVVNEYDGSIPTASCSLINLPASELLELLPVETPIKVATLASQTEMLNVDISIFEHNFTIFSNNDTEKSILISNFVRQLFRLKEKSVIIDTDGMFANYKSLTIGKDFKLPLNPEMIEYIFEYDLKEVDNTTKAVIQDVFYAVCQYIKTLEYQFLSIDKFIDVVTAQYKETQMPELALLKNKLLKYQEAGIFANGAEEFKIIDSRLNESNCIVFNLKDINGGLQKEFIRYIHTKLEKLEKYVYFFVPLYDDNSDKKLIKKFINNSHVFTTVFAPHNYKYATELKNHAQDMMFFAPLDIQHDFGAYSTFLNKLNPLEAVICGSLTQGVPLILSIEDLELDLTKDDVFGDREIFFPAFEEETISGENQIEEDNIVDTQAEEIQSEDEIEDVQHNDTLEEDEEQEEAIEDEDDVEELGYNNNEEFSNNNVIEPIENIMSDDYEDSDSSEIMSDNEQETGFDTDNELTEDDLDYIENNNETNDIDIDMSDIDTNYEDEERVPVVPVYTPEEEGEEISGDDIGYSKGDKVSHPRYGEGVIEKIIKYGNKTLCSIAFDNVGRRLLDPSITEFEKI